MRYRVRDIIPGPVKAVLRRMIRRVVNDYRNIGLLCSPHVKVAQLQIMEHYRNLVMQSQVLPNLSDTGYRVFSQTDEDGLLAFIFAVVGVKNMTFIDIGGSDGLMGSNCANLVLNFGWHGLFIDGNKSAVERGRKFYAKHMDTWMYPPKFVCAMVNRENINDIIKGGGFEGEVDLLSIDIDGNDYYVWEAINRINARVVIIETHIEFGLRSIVVPYDGSYVYPGKHPQYHGASPVAMVKLARRLGYRLVGSNRYGWNAIFIRNDVGVNILPEAPVEIMLKHPFAIARQSLFDEIKDYPYKEI